MQAHFVPYFASLHTGHAARIVYWRMSLSENRRPLFRDMR
jgi:hypothetical protein